MLAQTRPCPWLSLRYHTNRLNWSPLVIELAHCRVHAPLGLVVLFGARDVLATLVVNRVA
jgi:hypothetical protein